MAPGLWFMLSLRSEYAKRLVHGILEKVYAHSEEEILSSTFR